MTSFRLSHRLHRSQSGVALVVVLAVLVLLLGLVVTFLSKAGRERDSTEASAVTSRKERLTQLAVSLVKGQIRDATSQGSEVAWASQPGMIRTYGTHSPSGGFGVGTSLLRAFKLYSASNLITTSYTAGDDAPPENWAESKAIWSDLNAPVHTQDPDTGALIPQFPILDPAALNRVEGFDIRSDAPSGTVLSGTAQRIPMPVRWLYVLQDGRVVAPTETSGSRATIAGATSDNPIIGRIAFWTDDETSKVNVNTSSEGTYWDIPRTRSDEDLRLAQYQPAQNEFQRYPGHPAMTSLAPVLFAESATSTPELSAAQRDALYQITPKIVGGGSNAGTTIATGVLNPDSDRLYASIDELVYAADRSTQSADAGLTREKLEAAKFFLTTSSQAPEITLFNTPRVAMWPIFKDLEAARVTAFDRLIARATTINNQPYYFQRAVALSSTLDWTDIPRNRQLLRYLRALTDRAVPGFGEALVSKTTSQDRDQLLVEMMDYIRSTNLYDDNLTPNTFSSLASAFSNPQFTSGRYNSSASSTPVYPGHGVVAPLRVPANLGDTYPAEPDTTSLMGFGRFHTISDAALLFICSGDGSAGTPQDPIGGNSEAETVKRRSNDVSVNTALNGTKLEPDERRVQAILFFDWMSVMQGWTQYAFVGSVDVEWTGDFTLNGTSLGLTGGQTFYLHPGTQNVNMYHPWGGSLGIRKPLVDHYAPGDTPLSDFNTGFSKLYPLVSNYVTVKVPEGANPTMHFEGPSRILVKIYSHTPTPSSTSRELIQTIELHFPAADFPIPVLKTTKTFDTNGDEYDPDHWWSFNRRGAVSGKPGRLARVDKNPFSPLGNDAIGSLIWAEDTLRTLTPYHGDTRLVAGSHYVPLGVFQPYDGYFDTTRRPVTFNSNGGVAITYTNPYPQIKNQLPGSASIHYDASMGFYTPSHSDHRLVAGANYPEGHFARLPLFTPNASSATLSARPFQNYGDFDNGVAATFDGPYINKPDEGNNQRGSAGTNIPYFVEGWLQAASGPTFFSPNRQIPGPGMFGSLPTKLFSGNQAYTNTSSNTDAPWRTLLLRPQSNHPGAANPPDHLWLDFFWMPVVEPYAISNPFSTAGKVNMNYAIAPFSYIQRSTGLNALFRAEKILAVPLTSGVNYKAGGANTFRFKINAAETLKQFERRFDANNLFLTPSQICEIHLIPQGQTLDATGSNAGTVMNAFWQTHGLSGDNSRERPYTNLQTRLTTKSNTYTVHYRVQTLRKRKQSDAHIWEEGKDLVTGELRGSETIERYIEPNESRIPDYASLIASNPDANPEDLGNFYKWRTINTRRFAP